MLKTTQSQVQEIKAYITRKNIIEICFFINFLILLGLGISLTIKTYEVDINKYIKFPDDSLRFFSRIWGAPDVSNLNVNYAQNSNSNSLVYWSLYQDVYDSIIAGFVLTLIWGFLWLINHRFWNPTKEKKKDYLFIIFLIQIFWWISIAILALLTSPTLHWSSHPLTDSNLYLLVDKINNNYNITLSAFWYVTIIFQIMHFLFVIIYHFAFIHYRLNPNSRFSKKFLFFVKKNKTNKTLCSN